MPGVTRFECSTPEAEGIRSSAIFDFVHAVEQHDHPLDTLHSFMLLRHGNVAAEGWWAPYKPTMPHALLSVSKSFASTGIGLAVAEGLLTVDDLVLGFFPDDAPANPGGNLAAMRVRHLLAMTTGHHEDTTARVWRGEDDNWSRAFLSLPVEHQPGTWFVYNTGATYMLSAIITKLTGASLLDYLRPRLFDLLGIEHPRWDADPRGISIGGSGLHARTEDIARLGQLYLDKGIWNDQRLLSETWIIEATTAHSDNSNTQTNPDWTAGYGYQFWRCRYDAYRGDGMAGQFCIVMPGQDAVLAITSGLRDMQAVLDKVWDHLLPAMNPTPLPEDSVAQRSLSDTLASLALPVPKGLPRSPLAAGVSGTTFELGPNHHELQTITVTFGDETCTLDIHGVYARQTVIAAYGTWLAGRTNLVPNGHGDQAVAARYVWTTDDTLEVWVCSTEGTFCPILRIEFRGTELVLEVASNLAAESESIAGRATAS